jgi:hypothetical protein
MCLPVSDVRTTSVRTTCSLALRVIGNFYGDDCIPNRLTTTGVLEAICEKFGMNLTDYARRANLNRIDAERTQALFTVCLIERSYRCMYRKLKLGHNGDAVRQGSRGNGYFQLVELGARKARPYLASDAFAIHY